MIEEVMTFEWVFNSPTEIDIEETEQGVAIIRGTLLSEGVTANGHLYTIDEMENIARSAEGVPIYYGTMNKFDETLGMMKMNAHADVEPNRVGKIIKTLFNAAKRKIEYIAQIMNTESFPDLIKSVKKGWGISISGRGRGQLILDSLGRMVTKAVGMVVKSVQLLSPDTPRGQKSAQVEDVSEFQESMIFYEVPVNMNIKVNTPYSKTKAEFYV